MIYRASSGGGGGGTASALTCISAAWSVADNPDPGVFGLGITVPSGAIVVNAFVRAVPAFETSNGTSLGLGINTSGDLFALVDSETAPWSGTPGVKQGIPDWATPSDYVLATADREVTFTVSGDPLNAGAMTVYVFYVQVL